MTFHFLVQTEFHSMNPLLLYIYSLLFLPVMTCWFVYKILSRMGASTWCTTFKGFNSIFLLTFLSVCLIYLESPCPRHQSFPGFRASFEFKEPWVVRSLLKHMKGKAKKEVLLPSRMLHYALRKELNIHHLNVESSPCLGKEHPSQIECP